jgi:diaminopimelate epimerase
MGLHFTKMHGLGNDFVVVDARKAPVSDEPAVFARWPIATPALVSTSCW